MSLVPGHDGDDEQLKNYYYGATYFRTDSQIVTYDASHVRSSLDWERRA